MKKALSIFVVSLSFLIVPMHLAGQQLVNQEFYETGKLKSSTILDGEQYLIIQFFESGQIKEKCSYTAKQKDGKFESWHENGIKHVSIEYNENNPEGEWIVRNDSGQIVGAAKFDQGKLTTASMWDESGKLVAYR